MLKYRLEREDHWIKTLRTVYPYGLNERTKSMNKNFPTGKLFPSLSRYGTKFVDKRTRSSTKCRITDLDSLTHSIFSFPKEVRSNKVRILLNRLKLSNLKKLAVEASAEIPTCEDHLKRWFDLVLDSFLTKTFKENKAQPKRAPKHLLPIFFHNKGLELIQLKKILRKPDVISKLPEQLQAEDPPSIVYNLCPTIRNKLFNYKILLTTLI